MEHWPADERQKVLPVKNQGRGKKRLQVHDIHYWNHPCLDYGTFGGVTLTSSNGRLGWTTVLDTLGGELQPRAQAQLLPTAHKPTSSESDIRWNRALHFPCHPTSESDVQSHYTMEAN